MTFLKNGKYGSLKETDNERSGNNCFSLNFSIKRVCVREIEIEIDRDRERERKRNNMHFFAFYYPNITLFIVLNIFCCSFIYSGSNRVCMCVAPRMLIDSKCCVWVFLYRSDSNVLLMFFFYK